MALALTVDPFRLFWERAIGITDFVAESTLNAVEVTIRVRSAFFATHLLPGAV